MYCSPIQITEEKEIQGGNSCFPIEEIRICGATISPLKGRIGLSKLKLSYLQLSFTPYTDSIITNLTFSPSDSKLSDLDLTDSSIHSTIFDISFQVKNHMYVQHAERHFQHHLLLILIVEYIVEKK